jgi:FkbM family methyltransferase
MDNLRQRIAFVLAPTSHGPLILNRLDYHVAGANNVYGVGIETLEHSAFHPEEITTSVFLLDQRRKHFGDQVRVIDCGANIGVHTVEWARHMTGWGSVIAIEAQERIFYALAGNIALNNCFNARAMHAAVAAENGAMMMPRPDYLQPGSFGSLELRPRPETEFIGQAIDYSASGMVEVRCLALDSLSLERVDFIKIDVEAMEVEVLEGAAQLIAQHHPIIMIEWIKSAKSQLAAMLQQSGYHVFQAGMNLLAVHPSDPSITSINATPLGPAGPASSE